MTINQTSRTGFTIVELMVTVIVLAILAAIVIVVQSSWEERVSTAAVTNDLKTVSTAMESVRNFDDVYPTSLPDNFKASQHVEVTYHSGDQQNYCIEGQSTRLQTVQFYVVGDGAEPKPGDCS